MGCFYWYTFGKATSEVCSQLEMGWWEGEANAVEVLFPTSPAYQSVFHVTRSALDAVLAHACALVLPTAFMNIRHRRAFPGISAPPSSLLGRLAVARFARCV